jgi:hypothetical protein
MVVLLAVGEAMLVQAQDETLVGGGDIMVLPTGISLEMLKAGGTTALFLGLDQARFIQRQVLESPRGREEYGVTAASPLIDGRLVRVSRRERELQALASGEIPSRATAVGAAPNLTAGAWVDSRADTLWADPPPDAFFDEIDSFHLPHGAAVGDSTWAEWHYFNVAIDADRWIYLTYSLGGQVGSENGWGGRLLLTMRDPVSGHRSVSRDVQSSSIRFDTTRADLFLDDDAFVTQQDGVYHLVARVGGADLNLTIAPTPRRLFPPAEMGGDALISGYVVPALAARAQGRICLPTSAGRGCEQISDAPAYHDHNWGVWRDVSWEWGAASDDELSLLYGVVEAGEDEQRLFAYLVDNRGVRGLFRPALPQFLSTRDASVEGRVVRVPAEIRFEDERRGLSVDIAVSSFQVTDLDRDRNRYFVQMRGIATVRQAGFPERRLPGFFETYVN